MLLDAITVWVFSTGLWPNVIDATAIVTTKEWTGQVLKYPVLVFLDSQVRRFKLGSLHLQVLGNSFPVFLCPQGACGFAAIGTGQAIDAIKGLVVQVMHDVIQLPRRFLL